MNNLFATLSSEEIKKCRLVSYQKGEILFQESDLCQYVGIIVKGNINIVSYSLTGTDIIYNQLGPNGVFGNNLLFSQHPYYRGNVVSNSQSQVLLIDKNNFFSLLQNNQLFLQTYLEICSNFSLSLNTKMKLLSFKKADERLLYYLQIHNNEVSYNSVSSLAKSLFLERETLSRLLSKLEEEGIIIKTNKTIKLSKDK